MLDRKSSDDNGSSHAINSDPREQLDRLIEVARSMMFRREIEAGLLRHALDSVDLARVMRRSWTAPDEACAADLTTHHLRQLIQSLGGSAVATQ